METNKTTADAKTTTYIVRCDVCGKRRSMYSLTGKCKKCEKAGA